jgi:hypothetical protein
MKKDKIIRDKHESVPFVRLTTKTLFNEQLSDSGCRLLIAMLNNAEDWKVNVTYYSNKLGWSSGKTSNAKKNLIKCGYLKEEIEMTSKGKVYHYTINETAEKNQHPFSENRLSNSGESALKPQENKAMSLHPVSKDWKPTIGNQTLETNDWKQHTNNSNIDKSNLDKNNLEKNKEIKISDSVSVSTQNLTPVESTETKNTNAPSQEGYFFEYGERPSEEKIISYAQEKGYSKEVGCEVFLELHKKDFKNKTGTPIKGIQKYIDSMLSDRGKHSHYTSIESFIEAVKPVNDVYIRNSIKENDSIDLQTSKFHGKEASIEFWNSVSKDKNAYVKYMLDYIKSNGEQFKSMANFKKHIFNHRDRQIQDTGKTYV